MRASTVGCDGRHEVPIRDRDPSETTRRGRLVAPLKLTKIFILVGVSCVILEASLALPTYAEVFLFAVGFLCAIAGFICGLMHLRNEWRQP